MAETDSPEINCVYVDTNLDTHLGVLVHSHVTISDFKEKLCKEHQQCFPETGEIDISAVKVKRENPSGLLLDYHLPDSMCLSMAFDGISNDRWFVFVDAAVRIVNKCELPITMDSDGNCSNNELLEKDKEIATDSLLLDGYTKNPDEDFETQVVEKTTKKRKLKSSDGEKSRKKPSVDPNQSAVAAFAATASRFDVDESHELRGNVQVEVVASESSPREKLDETVTEATGKEIGMGEKSIEDVERDKIKTDKLVSRMENHLDTNSGLTTRTDTGKKKRRKKRSKDDISQSSAAAITTSRAIGEINGVPADVDPVDATPESLPIAGGNLDNPVTEASQKENEVIENSVNDVERDNIETNNLVIHTEDHLDTNSGLTTRPDTEKKKSRKKRSKDDVNRSSSATITAPRDIVNDINGVPANVDPVDDNPASLPISRGFPFAQSSLKENEMVEKSVEDVGRDNIETDNLVIHTEDHLDTNSGLTTRPDTEKKKSRKKRSKDDVNQSSSATITASRDIVNDINGVPANVDPVDDTPASLPISRGFPFAQSSLKENEMVEKSVEDVGRDNIETISHFDANSGLATGSDTEKKKRRRKSSKGDINKSFAATTTSGDIVNETNGVPANVDRVNATSEYLSISRRENLGVPSAVARQKETETGERIDEAVGGVKAIPSAVDNIQPNNVEIDADEANSVKPTKKRKSKKTKTPAKEDTLVASGAQNVEPVEVVDGEGTDNVIRNVLDSLQEKNETEEDLEKTGKKSSKKSKKKHSLKVAGSQVLSVEVNNAALEETPLINNPNDTDALFTPAKKDTESDASVLKKISEVADNAEDNSLSKKILIEKADMGDNFGCSQKDDDIVSGGKKQDQVTGGAKSKKEKGLDLHPSSSIDGSLSSMKPKAKKSRIQQPASSGTSLLQSLIKDDRSRSVRTAVNSKKEDVKKSSKPVTVEKRKTNFFEDAEKCNSSEDEYNKTSGVSNKTPSDYSSDDDSDVTSMSRKQGNNLDGGKNKFSGSLQDILRRSSSYKKALIKAQSQPDILDDVDCVPDSQAV